ncbi:MAG: thioredoxin family protein [Verrucomicrobiae bacterium]|nr:thioredoxin family protein [Verrucomicrobiae bacterium]NNJ42088.1 thioredoxin family protein [Akkermansiaceae bacterium]
MLERLASANGEKVRIVKVDANANRAWAANHQIRGVPAFLFYRGGSLVHQFTGAYPEEEIQRRIDQYAVVVDGDQPAGAEPAIKPMPNEWLPPGVTRE